MRRLVLIESPYAGDVEANVAYALRCVKDCIDRGEAPIAGHLMYTSVLDDTDPEQRALGIECHLAFHQAKIKTVVYVDHGISPGMQKGIDHAHAESTHVEYRSIGRTPR